MSEEVVIYHNPRCSKSRQTLELIKSNDINPTIVEYLKNPLAKDEVEVLLKKLDCKISDVIRKNEAEYKEIISKNPDLSDDEKINAIVEVPKLLERPIVVVGNKAVIGRPPENVLEII